MNKTDTFQVQKPISPSHSLIPATLDVTFAKKPASDPVMHWTAIVRFGVIFAALLFSFSRLSVASVLEDIEITEIREMALRDESGEYFLDIVSVIRNTSKNTMKFSGCRVHLSFALEDTKNIYLGTAHKKEIYMEGRKNEAFKETKVMLTTELGRDIERIHLAMIESEEMSEQLMEAEPEINLQIRGQFELGIQSQNRRAWSYQDEVRIDWITKTKVPRDVFIDTYKRLESLALKKSGHRKNRDNEWIDLDFEQMPDSNQRSDAANISNRIPNPRKPE